MSEVRMTYNVEERSQKSVGGRGPDRRVVIVGTPDGVERPYALDMRILRKLGCRFLHVDEGYSLSVGPRSRLGKARVQAQEWAEAANNGTLGWEIPLA